MELMDRTSLVTQHLQTASREITLLMDCNVHQDLWTECHRGFRTSGLNATGNIMGLVTELLTFKRYQSYRLTLHHMRRQHYRALTCTFTCGKAASQG